MLSVRKLNKVYHPKKGASVTALRDINLDIADKGLVFLLGKSGSGKSTLLNILGGLDTYSSGEIIIRGKSSSSFSKSDFDSYRNTFLGFIFQEFNILDDYSVGKNIGLALELQKKKADKEAVENILKAVDLEGFYLRRPNELSGGQKQRVSIARALVKNPDIILADEPTGSLDTNTGRQVFDVLRRLSKDKLIIVVSHDRENAEVYADRIIELKDGDIIHDRTRTSTGELADTPPINFIGENLIQFEAGYQLKQDDVTRINEMLSKSQNNVYMSFDSKSNIEFENKVSLAGGSTLFEGTSEKNLHIKSYDPKDFKLVRSRLPFNDSFKMGASGLKLKPIRLFFILILSLVSFTMLGFTVTASVINSKQIDINNFNQYGFQNIKIQARHQYSENSWAGSSDDEIPDEQLKLLEDLGGKKPLKAFDSYYNYGANTQISLSSHVAVDGFDKSDIYYSLIYNTFFTYLESPEKPEDANFTISAGRMPAAFSDGVYEIAINDWQAELFLKYGYRENVEGATTVPINEPKDLIDKKLYEFTIVGVVKTDVNIKILEKYKGQDVNSLSGGLSGFVANGIRNTSLGYVYVGKGFDPNLGNIEVGKQDQFNDTKINLADENDQTITDIPNSDSPQGITYYSSMVSLNATRQKSIIPSSLQTEFQNNRVSLENGEVFIGKDMPYFSNKTDEELESLFSSQNGIKVTLASDNKTETYTVKGIISVENSYIQNAANEGVIFSNSQYLSWRNLYNSNNNTVHSTTVILPLSSPSKYKELLNKLDSFKVPHKDGGYWSLTTYSNISEILNMIDTVIVAATTVFMWLGIVFAVFAGLLLMNFIGVSVHHKKKQIGILRAIGARSWDVFKIFFLEGALIGVAIVILSAIATAIISAMINSWITINVMSVGFITIGALLGLAVVIVYVSTWLPVHTIAHKKPIDAINNR